MTSDISSLRDLERNWTWQRHSTVETARRPKARFALRVCCVDVWWWHRITSKRHHIDLESPKYWSFKILANLCLLYFFRNIICEKLNFPTEKWINKHPCVSGLHIVGRVSIHIVNGSQLKKLFQRIRKQTKPKAYKQCLTPVWIMLVLQTNPWDVTAPHDFRGPGNWGFEVKREFPCTVE